MERGYSKHQVESVQTAMKVSETDAKAIIDYMDDCGFHPDWSEASWSQLRKHFKQVQSIIFNEA